MTTKFINSLLLGLCFIWAGSVFSKTHDANKYYVVSFVSYDGEYKVLRVTLIAEKDLHVKGGINADLESFAKATHNGQTYSLLTAIARYEYYSNPPYMYDRYSRTYQQKASDYVQELMKQEIVKRKQPSNIKKAFVLCKQIIHSISQYTIPHSL